VVSYKYVGVLLRADNRGEGGILALMALADWRGKATRTTGGLFAIGLFGAALLYGDGIITPAISVLGAIEGLGVATRALEPWVIWISLAIIIVLFSMQHRGTAKVGMLSGRSPWLVRLHRGAGDGHLRGGVLAALQRPRDSDLGRHGLTSLWCWVRRARGAGGEALYADMGHFGRRPIRPAWFAVVLPALPSTTSGRRAASLTRRRSRIPSTPSAG
jgi:KUP system potassium uptake protein